MRCRSSGTRGAAPQRGYLPDPGGPALDVLQLKDGREFERYHQVQRIGAEVTGDAWSFRDVTEQKRAEKALRESEQRFRTLAEASVEGVVLHEDGVILLANEGLARIQGLGIRGIRFDSCGDTFSPGPLRFRGR